MSEIIDALFEYACREGMEYRFIQQIPDYGKTAGLRESCLEALQAALPPEQQALLGRYLEAEMDMDLMEEKTLFRCGLTIGLKLGRPIP